MSLAKGGGRLNHPVEIMRFTLIYDGPLPAQSAHDSRVAEKHELRQQFHSQLVDLWVTHPSLGKKFKIWDDWETSHPGEEYPGKAISDPTSGPFNSRSPVVPFSACKVGKWRFVNLVCDAAFLTCELEILFLRKEQRGHLINQAGDLDNRIKVLFDALRQPQDEKEIPSDSILPDPFFCLLEDDRLITRVNVASERLLERSIPTAQNHVRLVINVTIRAQELTWMNLGLAE